MTLHHALKNTILIQTYFRRRKTGRDGCHCGDGKEGSGLNIPDTLEMKAGSNEVYDNPNYSHIMIGGKPFFILPSGELSEHVPVPAAGEQHTPRHTQPGGQQHIYEPGSSTYRSGSDYDTESSTYKPDSDRASNNGFPPIYEEIDKCSATGSTSYAESQFTRCEPGNRANNPSTNTGVPCDMKGLVPVQTMAVIRKEESAPHTVLHPSDRGPWTHTKSVSPRRPPSRIPNRSSETSSVYYYSDTLKRRGLTENGGREESDSGVSSRSGHNTSSESTPQPRLDLNRSLRGGRHRGGPVVSSDEDLSQEQLARRQQQQLQERGARFLGPHGSHGPHGPHGPLRPEAARRPQEVIDTQVIVRNTNRREPRANL